MKKETYDLGKGMSNISVAKLRFEMIVKSGATGGKGKDMIRGWIRRLDFILNEILHMLPTDAREIMEAQLLNEEDSQQYDAVCDMFLAMDKEGKDEMERIAEEILKVMP